MASVEDLGKESPSSELDMELEPSTEDEQLDCAHCSEKMVDPRVLSCLHVFCMTCIEKQLNQETGIECPKCKQVTCIAPKHLPRDHVLTNLLDMNAIASQTVLCTSCKTQEKAVARCSDCANFLCPNCNTAHQFMRCFEDHHVVSFEELKTSDKLVPIHKPILCTTHPSENLKFFCYTCQLPICNECVVVLHPVPEHHFERLTEAEAAQRDELSQLVTRSKDKVAKCEEASSQLSNTLSDLEMHHDNARSLIEETFQSYKAVLEKCRDEALEDLNKLHSNQELKIMETMHNMEKTMEQLEEAVQFTERLLDHGNAAEVLSLRKVIGGCLVSLLSCAVNSDLKVNLEFISDFDKFQTALKATFGHFKTQDSVPPTSETVSSSPPPQKTPALLPALDLSNPPSTSPPSLPVSMQSSFELSLPPSSVVSPTAGPLSPNLQLTSIQEYNLQQLASIAEREQAVAVLGAHSPPLPATTPSSNPSPTPFSLVDLFNGDPNSATHAINNLQALAKLGGVALNNPDLSNTTASNGSFIKSSSPNLENTLLSNAVSALNGSSYHATSPMPDDILASDTVVNGTTAPTNGLSSFSQHVRSNANKTTAMQIRCKFGQLGPSKGQFNSPHGFCLGNDEDIVVADTNNHRVQVNNNRLYYSLF